MNNNTFLTRLASNGSFVIANETFYQISEKEEGIIYPDSMFCGGLELALTTSGSLIDLERFYRSACKKEIFDYKKKLIQDILQRELMSGKDIKNYRDVKCALKFILEQFLPLMIDTAYEMGELLGVPNNLGVKTGRQVIDDLVKEEVSRIDVEDPSERIQRLKKDIEKQIKPNEIIMHWKDNFTYPKPNYNGNTSTLGFFTDHVPLYFSRGNVFILTPKDNDDAVFIIDGKRYSPVHYTNIESFDSAYYAELIKCFEREAITEFDAQFAQVLLDSKSEKGFEAFANKPRFQYGNLGYVRDGDAFYVYWEIPKFAMQNPVKPHLCNPYPAAKVALIIYSSEGKIFRSNEAHCIDPMIHPSLALWNQNFVKICNLSGRYRGSTAQDAMADLSDGINSFVNGLTMESLIRHGSRDEDCYFYGTSLRNILKKVGYLSIENAMEQGYKITNVWNHQEYNEALESFRKKHKPVEKTPEPTPEIPVQQEVKEIVKEEIKTEQVVKTPEEVKPAIEVKATPVQEAIPISIIQKNIFKHYYERMYERITNIIK